MEIPSQIRGDEDLSLKLRSVFWAVTIVSVFLQAWAHRFDVASDTVSYLDIGDAYFRRDWGMAVNASWSPLYSWLIVSPRHLLTIPSYLEPAAVQLVNWVIFVCVLACFEYFLSTLIRLRPSREADMTVTSLPAWALRMVGYGLFLYSSWIWLQLGSPDLCVEGIAFLAFACLIKLRFGDFRWAVFGGMGLLLGLGYLTKTAMFPLGFVFLATGFLVARRCKRAVLGTLLAGFVFLAVSAPLIYALSTQKGRLTIGDSPRINYAIRVNGLPEFVHWQGAEPGSGTPLHPTRRILDTPPVYEFATPVGGAYPPWTDTSYWWDGVAIHVSFSQQVLAIARNLRIYDTMIIQQAEFFAALLALCFFAPSFQSYARSVGKQWHLWIPSVAALLMYALVHVETRYVDGFWIVLWICLFSALVLPKLEASRKLAGCITLAIVVIVGARGLTATVTDVHYLLQGQDTRNSKAYSEFAQRLNGLGVRPGNKVAYIGLAFDDYWARLAGVSIVAEIPEEGTGVFWQSGPDVRDRVYTAFAATGAKAIVSNTVPPGVSPNGWVRIGQLEAFGETETFYAYLLNAVSPTPSR